MADHRGHGDLVFRLIEEIQAGLAHLLWGFGFLSLRRALEDLQLLVGIVSPGVLAALDAAGNFDGLEFRELLEAIRTHPRRRLVQAFARLEPLQLLRFRPHDLLITALNAAGQFAVGERLHGAETLVAQAVRRLAGLGLLLHPSRPRPGVLASLDAAGHLRFLLLLHRGMTLVAKAVRWLAVLSPGVRLKLLEAVPGPLAVAAGSRAWNLLVLKGLEKRKALVAHQAVVTFTAVRLAVHRTLARDMHFVLAALDTAGLLGIGKEFP